MLAVHAGSAHDRCWAAANAGCVSKHVGDPFWERMGRSLGVLVRVLRWCCLTQLIQLPRKRFVHGCLDFLLEVVEADKRRHDHSAGAREWAAPGVSGGVVSKSNEPIS